MKPTLDEIFNTPSQRPSLQEIFEVPTQQPSFNTVPSPFLQQETKEKKPGFLSRVGQAIQKRGDAFFESKERLKEGEQGVLSTGFQLAGQTVGTGFDIAFEGLKSVAGLAPDKLKEKVGEVGQQVLSTGTAQAGLNALSQGMDKYQEWKAENPRDAANLEAFGNIISIIPVGRAGQSGVSLASKAGQPTSRLGTDITERAIQTQATKIQQDVASLITPEIKRTKLPVGKKLTDIEEGGVFKPRQFSTDSPIDQKIIQTISEIPGIEKGNTLQKGQTMERFIGQEAQRLTTLTKDKDVIFPKKQLTSELERVQSELSKTPLLTGDAGKSAQRVLNKYIEEINKRPGKISSVLETRKVMDKWIRKFAGDKTLSGEKANAMAIAVKELRNTTNEFLIKNSPAGSEIRKSLLKQSNTYKALDNVTPKALREAGSQVERAINILSAKLGIRSKIVQGLALLTGIGTFGAMNAFAPVATTFFIGSLGIGGLYKLATSPVTRKQLGKAFQGIGKELDKLPTSDRGQIRETLELLVGMGIISSKEARLSEDTQE